MDRSIEQLGQDLARSKYAKTTQERYVRAARELWEYCRKPIVDLTRDDLRDGRCALVPWQRQSMSVARWKAK